jgi:hypothetical protein
MTVNADFRLIREKNIDRETTLKVTQNIMSGRIFVEFSSNDPNITLQKNFQNNFDGKIKSEEFTKSITSTEQLRAYFGIRKKKV